MLPDPLIEATSRLIREKGLESDLRHSPQASLQALGFAPIHAESLAKQGTARLMSYRKLVRNRLRDAIETSMPRMAARLGKARLDECLEDFVFLQLSRSAYLRDVPGEFLAFTKTSCEQVFGEDQWLFSLGNYELLAIEVASAEEKRELSTEELLLDAPLRFDESARLARYDYALHELSDDPEDLGVPKRRRTDLLAYRDRDYRIRYLELTSLAAAIVHEALNCKSSLRQAIEKGCDTVGETLTDEVLSQSASLLADLAERGVLLGSET